MTSQTRHAILIAGMHRSGTSAFARVANLLGAELGPGLIPAAPGNPRGYWEERTVVELNEECLQFFGLSWDNPAPLPTDWLESPWMASWCERLTSYLREAHGSTPLIVIKDPRLCRLLPAWVKVLASLEITPHIMLAFRAPNEVAHSLMRRDELSNARAKLLWLVHLLDGEHASRGLSRAFASYSDLLGDWQALVERLEAELGFNWPKAITDVQPLIEAFLNSGMRHSDREKVNGSDAAAISLLAAMVFAYAQASCEGHVVPARCWDEARQRLGRHLHITPGMTEESSTARDAARTVTTSTSGLWEPAEVISEVIQARLYFRQANQPATERRHVAVVVSTGTKPMHAKFSLPADSTIDFIRFDPAMRRGIYRILGIKINDRNLSLGEASLSAVHERLLPGDHGALLCFVSDDDDPHIELDMRALCASGDKPLTAEFTFECDSLLDRLEREMTRHERRLSEKVLQVQSAQTKGSAVLVRIESAICEMQKDLTSSRATSELARRRDEAQLQYELMVRGWGNFAPWQVLSQRVRLPGSTTALHPVPSQHLELLAPNPESNEFCWRATGENVFFQLKLPGSGALVAGWYLLGVDYFCESRCLLHPKIEIDYAEECGSPERIDLQRSSGVRSRLVLRCKQPTVGLRFCPNTDPGVSFLLSPPHLRRLTRVEALLRLGLPWVRTMRNHGHSWGIIWKKGWQALMRNSP